MAMSEQKPEMPFRLLGSSGLRVPLFSLGGCACDLFRLSVHVDEHPGSQG
jgi:hypothetical protein